MSRAKTQTTGFGRPLGARNPPQTQRARELLARSRGGVVVAERPLDPPGRKPRRIWQRVSVREVKTCNECGRTIEAKTPHYFDQASGHLVRHVECHQKAEAQR